MLIRNKKCLTIGMLGLGLIGSTLAMADSSGFKIDEDGLTFGMQGDPYWFSLGGLMQLDGVVFSGNSLARGTEFKSNSLNLNNAAIGAEGGFGKDWTYTLSIEMDGSQTGKRKFALEDAYVTYAGWGNNFEVSAGQVNPGFSLENTESGASIPFMKRSAPTNAFGPDLGLGVHVAKWGDRYSFNASATVPLQSELGSGDGANNKKSDHISTSARATYLPYRDGANLLEIGVSGHYERKEKAQFKAKPEINARNITEIVDTGIMDSKNLYTFSLEASAQRGPFYAEAEYQKVTVHRTLATESTKKVRLHGYHVEAAYMLTGESREYNHKNGTLNRVVPATEGGAWELAARYSFLNLTDHKAGVNGGKMHNVALGLNWHVNKNMLVRANYIRSNMKAKGAATTGRRKLNIFGARFQVML